MLVTFRSVRVKKSSENVHIDFQVFSEESKNQLDFLHKLHNLGFKLCSSK